MSKLLVKFNNNYADEFNVEGFRVVDSIAWDKHIEDAEQWFKAHPLASHYDSHEVGFGTNEGISYRSFADYSKSFKVTELTKLEDEALLKLFGKPYRGFGFFCDIADRIWEWKYYEKDEKSYISL